MSVQVWDEPNRRQGHLRIDKDDDPLLSLYFMNEGGGVITFGPMAGPKVEFTPEQLRVVGDYCHRMADRIDSWKVAG